MKSMGSGWKNLTIQLALKGLNFLSCESLSSMILMNYLNEMGEDETHLVGGMAASAPWNCTESTVSLEQPVNSYIFNRHLTKNLVNMVKR